MLHVPIIIFMCVGLSLIVTGICFTILEKVYAKDHEIDCVFTGETHLQSGGYLYQCCYNNET